MAREMENSEVWVLDASEEEMEMQEGGMQMQFVADERYVPGEINENVELTEEYVSDAECAASSTDDLSPSETIYVRYAPDGTAEYFTYANGASVSASEDELEIQTAEVSEKYFPERNEIFVIEDDSSERGDCDGEMKIGNMIVDGREVTREDGRVSYVMYVENGEECLRDTEDDGKGSEAAVQYVVYELNGNEEYEKAFVDGQNEDKHAFNIDDSEGSSDEVMVVESHMSISSTSAGGVENSRGELISGEVGVIIEPGVSGTDDDEALSHQGREKCQPNAAGEGVNFSPKKRFQDIWNKFSSEYCSDGCVQCDSDDEEGRESAEDNASCQEYSDPDTDCSQSESMCEFCNSEEENDEILDDFADVPKEEEYEYSYASDEAFSSDENVIYIICDTDSEEKDVSDDDSAACETDKAVKLIKREECEEVYVGERSNDLMFSEDGHNELGHGKTTVKLVVDEDRNCPGDSVMYVLCSCDESDEDQFSGNELETGELSDESVSITDESETTYIVCDDDASSGSETVTDDVDDYLTTLTEESSVSSLSPTHCDDIRSDEYEALLLITKEKDQDKQYLSDASTTEHMPVATKTDSPVFKENKAFVLRKNYLKKTKGKLLRNDTCPKEKQTVGCVDGSVKQENMMKKDIDMTKTSVGLDDDGDPASYEVIRTSLDVAVEGVEKIVGETDGTLMKDIAKTLKNDKGIDVAKTVADERRKIVADVKRTCLSKEVVNVAGSIMTPGPGDVAETVTKSNVVTGCINVAETLISEVADVVNAVTVDRGVVAVETALDNTFRKEASEVLETVTELDETDCVKNMISEAVDQTETVKDIISVTKDSNAVETGSKSDKIDTAANIVKTTRDDSNWVTRCMDAAETFVDKVFDNAQKVEIDQVTNVPKTDKNMLTEAVDICKTVVDTAETDDDKDMILKAVDICASATNVAETVLDNKMLTEATDICASVKDCAKTVDSSNMVLKAVDICTSAKNVAETVRENNMLTEATDICATVKDCAETVDSNNMILKAVDICTSAKNVAETVRENNMLTEATDICATVKDCAETVDSSNMILKAVDICTSVVEVAETVLEKNLLTEASDICTTVKESATAVAKKIMMVGDDDTCKTISEVAETVLDKNMLTEASDICTTVKDCAETVAKKIMMTENDDTCKTITEVVETDKNVLTEDTDITIAGEDCAKSDDNMMIKDDTITDIVENEVDKQLLTKAVDICTSVADSNEKAVNKSMMIEAADNSESVMDKNLVTKDLIDAETVYNLDTGDTANADDADDAKTSDDSSWLTRCMDTAANIVGKVVDVSNIVKDDIVANDTGTVSGKKIMTESIEICRNVTEIAKTVVDKNMMTVAEAFESVPDKNLMTKAAICKSDTDNTETVVDKNISKAVDTCTSFTESAADTNIRTKAVDDLKTVNDDSYSFEDKNMQTGNLSITATDSGSPTANINVAEYASGRDFMSASIAVAETAADSFEVTNSIDAVGDSTRMAERLATVENSCANSTSKEGMDMNKADVALPTKCDDGTFVKGSSSDAFRRQNVDSVPSETTRFFPEMMHDSVWLNRLDYDEAEISSVMQL